MKKLLALLMLVAASAFGQTGVKISAYPLIHNGQTNYLIVLARAGVTNYSMTLMDLYLNIQTNITLNGSRLVDASISTNKMDSTAYNAFIGGGSTFNPTNAVLTISTQRIWWTNYSDPAGISYDGNNNMNFGMSITAFSFFGGGNSLTFDNEAYGVGWSGDVTAPTKAATYAKINSLAAIASSGSASDLTTGTVDDARLSANVTKLGSDIDLSGSEATGVLAAGRFPTLTGDVTTTAGILITTLANSGVSAATYGSATAAPVLTIDAKGRTTTATTATITPAIGSVTGLGTGVGTFLATPSSANLASAITDETGSGAAVFQNSPVLLVVVYVTNSVANANSNTVILPGMLLTTNAGNFININNAGNIVFTSGKGLSTASGGLTFSPFSGVVRFGVKIGVENSGGTLRFDSGATASWSSLTGNLNDGFDDLFLSRSGVGTLLIHTNLIARGYAMTTNGVVLPQLANIPTNAIFAGGSGTNWTLCNLVNRGPVFVATNTATAGSFVIRTPTTTDTISGP